VHGAAPVEFGAAVEERGGAAKACHAAPRTPPPRRAVMRSPLAAAKSGAAVAAAVCAATGAAAAKPPGRRVSSFHVPAPLAAGAHYCHSPCHDQLGSSYRIEDSPGSRSCAQHDTTRAPSCLHDNLPAALLACPTSDVRLEQSWFQ